MGEVTIQSIAVAMGRVLGVEPEDDADVEGAADGAAGYIKALSDIGVELPTNYSEPTKRSDIVNATYQFVEKVEAERKEAENNSRLVLDNNN